MDSPPSPGTPLPAPQSGVPAWQDRVARLALWMGLSLHGAKELLLLILYIGDLSTLRLNTSYSLAHFLVVPLVLTLLGGYVGRWYCFRYIRFKFQHKWKLGFASGLSISAIGMVLCLALHLGIDYLPGADGTTGTMEYFTWLLWGILPSILMSTLHLALFGARITRPILYGRVRPTIWEIRAGIEDPDDRHFD